jgi:hypothetical protein
MLRSPAGLATSSPTGDLMRAIFAAWRAPT